MSVRVRIAPSPTGDPHVGTAYIALFNYCFARKHGGQFILRIEDTDRTRSTKESEEAILRALTWVGLTWDEGPDKGGPYGPYRQSERAEIYKEHAQILLDKGRAYRCFCTEARLEAMRDDQKKSGKFGYDRLCRSLPPEESKGRAERGETFVVRLAMPDHKFLIKDRLRAEPIEKEGGDDQVLLKSDGFPTYHLANVVDDHLMKITHVIRAEEWISSTPKHIELYDAFGWEAPVWCHMPLLRNADKSKISKRKNPVSLDFYRDAGFLPEALLNFLGLMGYSIGENREKFTLEDMISNFDLDRVSLGGPVFDLQKLTHFNSLYLREMTPAQIVERLRTWRLSDEHLTKVAVQLRERMTTLAEFIPTSEFFFSGDLDYTPVAADLVPKNRTPSDVAKVLAALLDAYDTLRGPFVATALDPMTKTFTEAQGWKTKELYMPLRLAITGRKQSPPLFDTMEILGKEITRRRLRQTIEFLNRLPAPSADKSK
jgi:glutamyl-tRNA synthetase